MSLEENKALYRRFITEAFNHGNLDHLDEILSPTYAYRDSPPGTPPGPDAIRQVVPMFRAAFPDLEITIDAAGEQAEGDCASRTTMRGTHKGALFGINPTGRKVAVPGLTMVRVENGRIAESWVKNDTAALMAQSARGRHLNNGSCGRTGGNLPDVPHRPGSSRGGRRTACSRGSSIEVAPALIARRYTASVSSTYR